VDGGGGGEHWGLGAGGDAGGLVEAGLGEEIAVGPDLVAFRERGRGIAGLRAVKIDGRLRAVRLPRAG
jgi:hypothetical protein